MMNIINQCNEENYEPLIKKVVKQCYKALNIDKKRVVNIVLVTDEAIKTMNKNYRDKDYVTDVLTFPSDLEDELGDIFIAVYKAHAQAREYGHTFERELAFLVVHGILHTLGYDHETKEEETKMFALQEELLNQLKITR